MKLVIISLILCGLVNAATLSYFQGPPPPPGFTTYQSPKGAETTSPPYVPPVKVTVAAEHLPPVASIEWRAVQGGPYGVPGSDVTHPVPFRMELTPWGHVRLIHEAVQGRTYEVQVKFDIQDTQWYTYTRSVAPTSNLILTDHPVYTNEPFRFFRVMGE